MTQAIKLYRHPLSGHCHRVELMLSLLGLPSESIEVDLLNGEHRTPAFTVKNSLAQIPVIEDGELTLSDSNAILVYLAARYDSSGQWLPREPVAAAHVQRWLSLAAGELVRGPGRLRLAVLLGVPVDKPEAERITSSLFGLIDRTLATQPYLAGDRPTLADVAQYAYTALAPEGGVALEPYSQLRAWHARMEALPRFVPVQRTAAARAAS